MRDVDPRVYRLILGKVVAGLRKNHGISQLEFAKRIGVSQPTLSRIERGQAVPDVLLFGRIAENLGLTPAELHEVVEESLRRAQEAAAGATHQAANSESLWTTAFAIAGLVGLAGLVAFAVAAALKDLQDEDEDENELYA